MQKITELRSELITLMKAKNSLIVIETFEEIRALNLIQEISEDQKVNRKVKVWSCTKGLIEIDQSEPSPDTSDPMAVLEEIENTKSNGQGYIFVLLDYDKFIGEGHPDIVRKVRDLSVNLKNTKKSIIFISPSFKIPSDLTKSMTLFDLPFPSKEEIEITVRKILNGIPEQIVLYRDEMKSKPELTEILTERITELVSIEEKIFSQWNQNKDVLINAFRGLTEEEVQNVTSRCIIKRDLNVKSILDEKRFIIRKYGGLEYIDASETMKSIGGLGNAKLYAERAAKTFSEDASKYGIKPVRSILLVGSPGTGKSLFCKAISNVLRIPLIRMDMTAQRSKWLGESGQNMIQSLKVMHSVEPVIGQLDEIEKNINRSTQSQQHQEDASVLATLLTDMEEKSGILFIATCNNPSVLPPELLSRFQKIFCVDLPTLNERKEIFSIHLKEVQRNPENYDLNSLAKSTEGYSGREIRNIIQESLIVSFDKGIEIDTETILTIIPKIIPVSVQKKSEIAELREWSSKYAENASSDISEPVQIQKKIALEI
jgi:SpoVK/Ycf46/Vps4 family AAA+-type ATPase